MQRLTDSKEIWSAKVTKPDINEALEYATISLPWTFDRMRYGPRTQNSRNRTLFHIMYGVLNQTILQRLLEARGLECSKDWTHYRVSDVFDFVVDGRIYDVKTMLIFSQYDEQNARPPFTTGSVTKNRSYSGREWKRFFPMLVTHSQIDVRSEKDSYIFGIGQMLHDMIKARPEMGDGGFWAAPPYETAAAFFQSVSVISARENDGAGFQVALEWRRGIRRVNGIADRELTLTLFGEWDEEPVKEEVRLPENGSVVSSQEFSSLSCLRAQHPAVLDSEDRIVVTAVNHFDERIQKLSDPRVDLNDASFSWVLDRDSFVNLDVPSDYRVHWVGHIPLAEFAQTFQSYPAYFSPSPANLELNVDARPADGLRRNLSRLGRARQRALEDGLAVHWPDFSLLIQGNHVEAGLLVAAQMGWRSLGAACYYYPPYGFRETALYVLPKDLYLMESIS